MNRADRSGFANWWFTVDRFAFFLMLSVQIAWWLILVGCEVTANLELGEVGTLPDQVLPEVAPPAASPSGS